MPENVLIFCFVAIIIGGVCLLGSMIKDDNQHNVNCNQITPAKVDTISRFTSSNGMHCDVVRISSLEHCFGFKESQIICTDK